ncbi:Hypothetical protein SMAX5B_004668, partial [Scophthalmus maximus]
AAPWCGGADAADSVQACLGLGGLMQQGHRLIHSPSSSARTSKDAQTVSRSPYPPVQAVRIPPPQGT